jgi:phage terminase large subunit GpA-like protein
VWTSGVDHYDGAIDIEKNWREGLRPDPFLDVSQWSDKYRVLSPKSAAEPGRWRTERTPYLKEIMDCLSVSSPVQRVVFMKGAQVGGTEAGNNWIGYVIHIAPGPMMAVSPTVEMAKRNSRQRIDPQIEDVSELRERVAPARSRDSGNTVLSKEFPGGVLVMTGANSAVGLRSMPARYLFMDEVDGYPGDVEGEGDPILLAERRSATFQRRRKILLVSTPTIKGLSRIQREFEASDQRYYQVPCPECGFEQPLRFTQLRWPEGNPEQAQYCCESCGALIDEHHKSQMLAKGRWVPSAEGDGRTQGYHLSSLYSPVGWFSWADAARLFETAQNNPDLMKGFVNTVLGEPYEEEFEAPEWERLYERREKYPIGIVPQNGLFLTAGVDVQRDRLECEVVAWGRNKISWSVDYQVLDGDTAQPEVWQKLDVLLSNDWPHAAGGTLPIRVMCVDSGYATQDVYGWVRKYPQAVWGGAGARASQPRTAVAIKGRDQDTALILSVSKADTGGKRKGLRVWNVSGPVAKVELYRWLKLPRPTDEELAAGEDYPPGTCHYPEYGEEYFKQLTAERRVIRLHKGFPKATWEKDPARNNEALDCRVYARAAASIYGLDRFKEIHWKRLEQALGVNAMPSDREQPSRKTSSNQTVPKTRPRLMQRSSTVVDDPYL